MLTQEQIKNLKPGDPLIINGTFVDLDDEGDIEIKISYRLNSREIKDSVYGSPSCVSLPSEHGTLVPTPKYDPTRLFKKGDKVRIVEYKGRRTGYDKKIYKVCEDEEESGRYIKLSLGGYIRHFTVDAAYIELVTPVEEMRPYSIDPANTNVLFKRGKKFATFEDDDEAQELCDCLNAEYRKEHE